MIGTFWNKRRERSTVYFTDIQRQPPFPNMIKSFACASMAKPAGLHLTSNPQPHTSLTAPVPFSHSRITHHTSSRHSVT